MADDLLARLRNPMLAWTEHSDGKVTLHQESLVKDFGDAADEIERLREALATNESLVRGYVSLLQGEVTRSLEQKAPER